MKAWQVHLYGEPADVMTLDEVAKPEPGPGQLLVKVAATTLNYNDLDGIRGRYLTVKPPLPFIPGMEVVGTVAATGHGCDTWQGKRVCAAPEGAFGGFAEYALCPATMAFEMPESINDADAAALYFPFHLSSLSLFTRAQLKAGESVLVHAAAGGIGSAAVQLAKAAGATVIATAGNDNKLALCRELGADEVINYTTHDFADRVNAVTDGRGVDVVFDTVGGEVTEQSMRCLAFNGRLVMVGFSSGIEAEDEAGITPRPLMFGNFSLYGVCLAYVEDSLEMRRLAGMNFPSHRDGEAIHQQILDWLAAGKIQPVIGQQGSFDELPRLFEALANRSSTGRSIALLGD